MNEAFSVEEIQLQESTVEKSTNEPFYKKYKRHLSVAAAVVVVGVSALSHYKNGQVKEELVKAIAEYQKGMVLLGAEMSYKGIECGGFITTDCEIEGISLFVMGQEQLSIGALRLGDVEALSELKAFRNEKSIETSIDIEADEVAFPKPMMAQMIAQNVSNAFQQSTLGKLATVNLSLKGEIEGNAMNIKRLEIDALRIDNAIMPLEFSMNARDVSSQAPDSMILEAFSLGLENRAIADVTYESVKSFADTLSKNDQAIFLKEFSLTPTDLNDRKKASKAINLALAKRFEADLPNTAGVVEKDLTRAIIKVLKGESDEIVLAGNNQNKMTMAQVQKALEHSLTMSDDEARKFMEDKFKIEVETD